MLMQRFSPRRKSCNWSELNKERCRRMEKLGLMTESGRSILPDISSSNFVISSDILSALQGNEGIWENFQKFPSLYKRVRIDTIQSTRKCPKIFQSRLQKFLDKTKSGIMYGEWNDYGRLLNYWLELIFITYSWYVVEEVGRWAKLIGEQKVSR